MSSEAASPRKRKPTKEPELELVVSSDNCDDQSKSKSRRVSTDASASTNAKPLITKATSEAASNGQQDDSILSIG